MRVGWIGLGSMGKPMALALLRRGFKLIGHARRPHDHDDLRAAGGIVTDHVAEAVTGADAVCINLYSEEQLREVMITQAGLVAVKAGALVIVHSTVSPDAVQELAAMRPDIAVLDAGFSGGPAEAEAGKLTLMVGGKESDFERARPVLSAYGEHIAHLGPLGAGMTLKLINNLTFAAHIAIAQDALRLCEANGLALDVALATLGSGSAGSTALALLARNKDPHAMIAGIRHYLDKDVAIARAGSRHMDIGVLDGATRGFARGNRPE